MDLYQDQEAYCKRMFKEVKIMTVEMLKDLQRRKLNMLQLKLLDFSDSAKIPVDVEN